MYRHKFVNSQSRTHMQEYFINQLLVFKLVQNCFIVLKYNKNIIARNIEKNETEKKRMNRVKNEVRQLDG